MFFGISRDVVSLFTNIINYKLSDNIEPLEQRHINMIEGQISPTKQ